MSASAAESAAETATSKPEPMYLNVYDLTPLNNYFYWFGLGIFHSGVEAHGTEYAFGAHDFSTSGVFEVEPRSCPGFIYRNSIPLGTTDKTPQEFRSFMEHIASDYNGDTYNLIIKNCNHFSNDISAQLTGKDIPAWVNRLARIGWLCNCLLPEGLQVTTVADEATERLESIDEIDDNDSQSNNCMEDVDNESDERHLLMPPKSDRDGGVLEYPKDSISMKRLRDPVS